MGKKSKGGDAKKAKPAHAAAAAAPEPEASPTPPSADLPASPTGKGLRVTVSADTTQAPAGGTSPSSPGDTRPSEQTPSPSSAAGQRKRTSRQASPTRLDSSQDWDFQRTPAFESALCGCLKQNLDLFLSDRREGIDRSLLSSVRGDRSATLPFLAGSLGGGKTRCLQELPRIIEGHLEALKGMDAAGGPAQQQGSAAGQQQAPLPPLFDRVITLHVDFENPPKNSERHKDTAMALEQQVVAQALAPHFPDVHWGMKPPADLPGLEEAMGMVKGSEDKIPANRTAFILTVDALHRFRSRSDTQHDVLRDARQFFIGCLRRAVVSSKHFVFPVVALTCSADISASLASCSLMLHSEPVGLTGALLPLPRILTPPTIKGVPAMPAVDLELFDAVRGHPRATELLYVVVSSSKKNLSKSEIYKKVAELLQQKYSTQV